MPLENGRLPPVAALVRFRVVRVRCGSGSYRVSIRLFSPLEQLFRLSQAGPHIGKTLARVQIWLCPMHAAQTLGLKSQVFLVQL
jgi:hypothetical protein